jgi:hypothetical protein
MITVAFLMAAMTMDAHGQSFSPYSAFQAMSPAQLQTLQGKLTYLGEQAEIVSTVAFTATGNPLQVSLFTPFHRSGFEYGNDVKGVQSFTASTDELKAMVDLVGTLPNVTAGGVASRPYISFAMLSTAGGTEAFDATLDKDDTVSLFGKLRIAFQNNTEAIKRIESMACAVGVLDPQRPKDVSSDVAVSLSGLRLNRGTERFVGTATINNTSATSVVGPISTVFIPAGNVRLFNASGFTCGVSPSGWEFVNVPGPLKSGNSASFDVEFVNLDLEPVKITTKVLAGLGSR